MVLVCLSAQSVTKEGFVQKEIKFALDKADEKPDGTIFIIPARIEDCDVPERISKFHWVDLFSDDGYEWLIKALQIRAESVGAIIEPKKTTNITSQEAYTEKINLTAEPLRNDLRVNVENSFHEKEKSIEAIKPDTKEGLLLDSDCCYFSSEYAASFIGKYFRLFEKKGALYFNNTSLVFSNEGFVLDIPFESITGIETKTFSRWVRSVSLAYVEISFIKNGEKNSVGIMKISNNMYTTGKLNQQIKGWIESFSRFPELSAKIKQPLLIPLPSTTKQEITINVLIGIALMVFGFLVLASQF